MVQFRDWLTQLDMMQKEMDRLFEHFAGSKPPQVRFSPLAWEPAVDVYEDDKALIVIVELAGVDESNIQLEIDRNILTIRGERKKYPQTSEKRAYYRMEITSGPFKKSIQLPVAVDASRIKATYNCGLVEVILPKHEIKAAYRVRIRPNS